MWKKCNPRAFTPLSKWDVLQYLGLCECVVFITGSLNWGQKVKHSNSLMSCDMDKVVTTDFRERPAAPFAWLPRSLPVVFQRSSFWLFIYQIKVIKPSSNKKPWQAFLKCLFSFNKSAMRFNLDVFSLLPRRKSVPDRCLRYNIMLADLALSEPFRLNVMVRWLMLSILFPPLS